MATVAAEPTPPVNELPPPLPVFVQEDRFEVVKGAYRETVALGAYEVDIASLLMISLGAYVREHRLGKVVSEMLFVLNADAGLQRRPDLAFVSKARWPVNQLAPATPAWNVVPDLAVEVISPTNLANEVMSKIGEYLQAGVPLIWIIYPHQRQVYSYESAERITVFQATDVLTGGAVLPEFRLPLSEVFLPSPEATTTPQT